MKINNREVEHEVNDLFPKRWSPRAMSGDSISDKELMGLFEAARWAPSAYNEQPWRFVYAKRDTPEWDKLFELMIEFNQMWTKNAAVLIVILSSTKFKHNNKPNQTHSFDSGSAWQSIAFQASLSGLVSHAMSGIDYEKARTELEIPEDFNVEAMIAIGKPGKTEDLPEAMQKSEIQSPRIAVSELIHEGVFKK